MNDSTEKRGSDLHIGGGWLIGEAEILIEEEGDPYLVRVVALISPNGWYAWPVELRTSRDYVPSVN